MNKTIEELEVLYNETKLGFDEKLSDKQMHDIFKKEFDLGIDEDEDLDYIFNEMDLHVLEYTFKYYPKYFTDDVKFIGIEFDKFEFLLKNLSSKIDLTEAFRL
jgi:hypothetical protein